MRKVISFIYLISVCINISHAQTYDSIEKEFGSLIDNLAKDFSQHDYILSVFRSVEQPKTIRNIQV